VIYGIAYDMVDIGPNIEPCCRSLGVLVLDVSNIWRSLSITVFVGCHSNLPPISVADGNGFLLTAQLETHYAFNVDHFADRSMRLSGIPDPCGMCDIKT